MFDTLLGTPSIQCKAHGCSQPGNRSCQFEYCYVDCIERQKQIRESQHIALSLGHRPANFDTPKCVVHQPKKRKRSSASSAGSGMSGPTSPVFHHPGEDMMLGLARPRQRRATMPGVLPFGGPPGGLPGGFNPFHVFGTAGGLAGANGINALAQQFKGASCSFLKCFCEQRPRLRLLKGFGTMNNNVNRHPTEKIRFSAL